MVNYWDTDSSLSRLRHVLSEAEPDGGLPATAESPDWEEDLREIAGRLERLRNEFPALAGSVELNVALVKAGESLEREAHGSADAFARGSRP